MSIPVINSPFSFKIVLPQPLSKQPGKIKRVQAYADYEFKTHEGLSGFFFQRELNKQLNKKWDRDWIIETTELVKELFSTEEQTVFNEFIKYKIFSGNHLPLWERKHEFSLLKSLDRLTGTTWKKIVAEALEVLKKFRSIADIRKEIRETAFHSCLFEDLSYKVLSGTVDFPLSDILTMRLVNKRFKNYADTNILPLRAKDVFGAFVKRNTDCYWDYIKDEGWTDYLKIIGKVALTVLSVLSFKNGVEAYKEIPENAPTKLIEDGDGRSYTVYDHPKSDEAFNFFGLAGGGLLGIIAIEVISRHNLKEFNALGISRDELLDSIPFIVRVISPDFINWKMKKIHENIIEEPKDWKSDLVLSQSICQLSLTFTKFSVIDPCGHRFDYLKIKDYIESQADAKCPISRVKLKLEDLKLDFQQFNMLQNYLQNKQNH